MNATKKILKELLEEYIADACKPDSQPEARLSDFFDKKSTVDEMYLSISMVGNIRTIENLRRVVRLILQMAEEDANKFKIAKVTAPNIAFSFSTLHSITGEYVIG